MRETLAQCPFCNGDAGRYLNRAGREFGKCKSLDCGASAPLEAWARRSPSRNEARLAGDVSRLKAALRVNALRWGATHADVDKLLADILTGEQAADMVEGL